jgi:hypothetical protein
MRAAIASLFLIVTTGGRCSALLLSTSRHQSRSGAFLKRHADPHGLFEARRRRTTTTRTTTRTAASRAAQQEVATLTVAEESLEPLHNNNVADTAPSIWESAALVLSGRSSTSDNVAVAADDAGFTQIVSALRVGVPSLLMAVAAKIFYPGLSLALAALIDDTGVFEVVAQDSSQYIQNILTTSGLVFSLLVGQTHYFMYQQQEATYLALYEEVTMAKSLLEQTALVCQGREELYLRILRRVRAYVKDDLQRFNDIEPAVMLSARPCDDPLEDILYLTSVGEPSTIYQTVRALRQARALRLAALQRKLPAIHMTLLWVLAFIVLFTFPLLGAGVQTIGGEEILQVQSIYLGFIVLGMTMTLGVVYELQRPGEVGAYNARRVLAVMVRGLNDELDERLSGNAATKAAYSDPSIDSDGGFSELGAPATFTSNV